MNRLRAKVWDSTQNGLFTPESAAIVDPAFGFAHSSSSLNEVLPSCDYLKETINVFHCVEVETGRLW